MEILNLSSIVIPDRFRKDYGDLSGLVDSLRRIGSIHPIVLDPSGKLIAGGRRLAAYKEIGVTEVFHNSILNPDKLGFAYSNEIPEHTRREAEIDENFWRLQPKWQEEVIGIAEVHALKREIHGTGDWGLEHTAQLLGKGYGKGKVSLAVRLAKLLRANDKDILEAENMSDAVAVLFKRREEEALAEMGRRASIRNVGDKSSMSSFLDTLNINLQPRKVGDVTLPNTQLTALASNVLEGSDGAPNVQPAGAPIEDAPVVEIPLSRMFVQGDCIALMPSLPAASFDHVITDIPYGINMDNLDTFVNIDSVKDQHEVDQNVEMMEPFLKESFRLVKSGGFCVFFYDLDWHEYLQSTAEALGWKVQRWPLIAYKTSACRNSAAQYNFTKNYECAMVLRRDEHTVLRSAQSSSVWMGDFAAERKLYNNPFAKPFTLWKWIYNAVAFQGQKVFDPFCGEMSAARAAVNCGLVPFGVELDPNHYARGLENMKAVYALMHKGDVNFT